jgi:hypothetical protein
MFYEAHARRNGDDALLGGLCLMLRVDSEGTFKGLGEADVGALSYPFADGFFPGVDGEAFFLLGGRKRLELGVSRCQGAAALN